MKRRLLLFGAGGKIGTALNLAFADGYELLRVGPETDVTDAGAVRAVVAASRPDLVCNAKVVGGVDFCEREPLLSHQINTRLPALLAGLSAEMGFTLVHFSSESLFPDCAPGSWHTESSPVVPLNVYALTKFGADCLVQNISPYAYVLRLSLQFGPRPAGATQFVERMIERAQNGDETLRVSSDVICTPSYSLDVAARVRSIVEDGLPFGLYHVANQGQASLFELLSTAVDLLGLSTRVEPVPGAAFPSVGRRSSITPIRSEKIPPLRPWQEALADFCSKLQEGKGS